MSGTDEAISSRFVTVIVNNVDPTAEYSYTANPQAIDNGASVSLNGIQGIVPAAIQGTVCLHNFCMLSVTAYFWHKYVCIKIIFTINFFYTYLDCYALKDGTFSLDNILW